MMVRIITSSIRVSAFGDLAFGVIMIGLYLILARVDFVQSLMLISLLVPAVIIFVCIGLATSLSSFFMPDAVSFARNLFEIFLTPSLFPSPLFQGALRTFFIFVVPSLVVGGLPIEVIQQSSWLWYAVIWGIAFFWMLIMHIALARALRFYESGNLVGARI